MSKGNAMHPFHTLDDRDGLLRGQVDHIEGGAMRDEEMVIHLVDGHIVIPGVAGQGYLLIENILLTVKGLGREG